MKHAIILGLLLTACGSSSHSTDDVGPVAPGGNPPSSTASEPVKGPNTNLPGTDAYGNYVTTSWYPSDAPLLRTDLYSCGSIGRDLSSNFKVYVEIFTDKSRKYHSVITLANGTVEKFVATESASNASPFTPIAMLVGARQSSDVLNGISEQTKSAYGLSSDANWKINMRSSQRVGNIEMFVSVDANTSVTIPYGVCYRVGQ